MDSLYDCQTARHWPSQPLNGQRYVSLTPSFLPRVALSPVHTSNNVEAAFDFVEATFDFVAKNGNNVEGVFVKFRPFDKVETN